MEKRICFLDKANKEERHGSPGFSFYMYTHNDESGQFFAPYHWHEEMEILSVTDGSIEVKTADTKRILKAGQVYFIQPGTLHSIQGHSRVSEHYALIFEWDFLRFFQYDFCQRDFLDPVFSGKYRFPDGDLLSPETAEEIAGQIEYATSLFREMQEQEKNKVMTAPLSIKISLLRILEILYRDNVFIKTSEENGQPDDRETLRLKAVFSYIEEHYAERISLEDLASLIRMNQNYFCRFFRQKTGKRPFSYLNEYRINRAARLLQNTDMTVMETALETGFDNISYFNRQFKNYQGCTPSKFRARKGETYFL